MQRTRRLTLSLLLPSLIAVLFGAGLVTDAQAQETGWEQEGQLEVNLAAARPLGAFGEHLGETGLGLSVFAGGYVPQLPLVLGTELALMNFGFENHLELTRSGVPIAPDIPVSTLDVESSTNVLMGHLVARLQPRTGAVRPYLDALLGLRYFFSRTRIRSDFFLDLDEAAFAPGGSGLRAAATFEDLALSYGVGGGLSLRVYTGAMGGGGRTGAVSLHLGVRYLRSPEVKYLSEDAIRRTGEQIVFDVVASRADLLVPQFGLRVDF